MYLEWSGGVGIEVKCLVKTDSPSETPDSASSSNKNTGSYTEMMSKHFGDGGILSDLKNR